ncbi:MAG: UvrB/UvrC motif-containing protein, partial [Blautia marasmi]
TDSMRLAIDETMRRRKLQQEYNEAHGITPQTIRKAVRDLISISKSVAETENKLMKDPESMNKKELKKLIQDVEKQMRAAAADLNFEMAAELRDKMIELRKIWKRFQRADESERSVPENSFRQMVIHCLPKSIFRHCGADIK